MSPMVTRPEPVEGCPPEPKKSNLRGCLNLTIRQQVIISTIIFLIMRAEQFPYYVLVRLDAELVLKFLATRILKERQENVAKYMVSAHALETWSIVLMVHELLTMIAVIGLMFGVAHSKFEVVKGWVIFMSLHYSIGVLIEALIFFYVERYILSWPLLVYLPFLMGMFCQCFVLMKELHYDQWQKDHNPINPQVVKAKEIYNKGVIRAEKKKSFAFDPNANQSNYILA